MANTQAMTTSFKVDLFNAVHAFNATGIPAHTAATADTFKAALYLTSATVNASTTAYSSTNEVTGTNYTAGGVTVTFGTAPTSTGTTAFITPSASITYTNVTLNTAAFNAVLIYNSTQSNKAVSVHTFGDQTITAGTFTLVMPTNAASTALLNIA
jgi:intracellular septation protein A